MWDWEWVDCSEDDDDCVVASSPDEHDEDTCDEDKCDEDKCDEDAHDESESHDSSDKEDIPNITHSVIFKCIGATKEHRYQQLLDLAKQKKSVGETVPVKLKKEPSNLIDSQAIALCVKLTKSGKELVM